MLLPGRPHLIATIRSPRSSWVSRRFAPSGIWLSILRPSPAQPWHAWQFPFCRKSLMPSAMSDASGACARAAWASCNATSNTRAAPTGPRSERVKPRRIVHEDLLADSRIARPHRKEVEHQAVVDLEERRQLSRLASRARIRMRPVRPPEDALGVRRD